MDSATGLCDVFLSVAPYGFTQFLYPFAFNALQITVVAEAAKIMQSHGVTEYAQHLNWHAVQGSRMKAGRGLYDDPTLIAFLIILAIALEALQFLTAWLIVRGRSAYDARANPPLFDMVNDDFSPVVVLRQYLAGLLAGSGSRLQLLFRRAQCASIRQLIINKPEWAAMLRRVFLNIDAWIYKRFVLKYKAWPWPVVRIADLRLPWADRLATAVLLLGERCLMCLDEFFTRRLRSLYPFVLACEFVTDRFWLNCMRDFAVLVVLHIAAVETRHARNRRSSKLGETWSNFVSRYVVQEAQSVRNVRKKMWGIIDPFLEPLPAPASYDWLLQSVLKARRTHKPLEVYQKQYNRERRIDGEKVFVTTDEYRTAVRTAFVALSATERQRIDALAEMTTALGRQNRNVNDAQIQSVSAAASASEPVRHGLPMLNLVNEWIAQPSPSLPTLGESLAMPVMRTLPVNTPSVHKSLYNVVVSKTIGKVEGVVSNFESLVTILGTGSLPPQLAIPIRVVHPEQCATSGLCVLKHPPRYHLFHDAIVRQFDEYRKQNKWTPAQLPMHDLVLAFVLSPKSPNVGESVVRFAVVSACSGQHGNNPPLFLFHQLDPVADFSGDLHDFNAILLRIAYCSATITSRFPV